MLLLTIKKLKKGLLNSGEYRKYLLYGSGEIILIIIGILFALQIDNWNSERLQQNTLENYLKSIGRNIDSDLKAVSRVRSERELAYQMSSRMFFLIESQNQNFVLTIPQAQLVNQTINRAMQQRHFINRNSAYDSLKSSGTLDQIQGTEIEQLLYDYYDTVERIHFLEEDHNNRTNQLWMQVLAIWPEDVARWEISAAQALSTQRFNSLQSSLWRLLRDYRLQELLNHTTTVASLILEYDKLYRLGTALKPLLAIGQMHLDENGRLLLDAIYDPAKGVGNSDVVINGNPNLHSFSFSLADANDPRLSETAKGAVLQQPYDTDLIWDEGGLHVTYKGGAEWAGLWFFADTEIYGPIVPDYSGFKTLQLEMKGNLGGESVSINLEDVDDRADGTSTRVEIRLSDQWQTYEVDLARFETADLEKLVVPLGFVFEDQPVSFSIRNARFVQGDASGQ